MVLVAVVVIIIVIVDSYHLKSIYIVHSQFAHHVAVFQSKPEIGQGLLVVL